VPVVAGHARIQWHVSAAHAPHVHCASPRQQVRPDDGHIDAVATSLGQTSVMLAAHGPHAPPCPPLPVVPPAPVVPPLPPLPPLAPPV
jgi:hypothetical protein